jgi:hypothetical protein
VRAGGGAKTPRGAEYWSNTGQIPVFDQLHILEMRVERRGRAGVGGGGWVRVGGGEKTTRGSKARSEGHI